MHLGKGPTHPLRHNARRALIIRRHRARLEAEVRAIDAATDGAVPTASNDATNPERRRR